MFGMIWKWRRGVEPDWRQRFKEAQVVELLADEIPASKSQRPSPPPTAP
jgi:hypothetical protein